MMLYIIFLKHRLTLSGLPLSLFYLLIKHYLCRYNYQFPILFFAVALAIMGGYVGIYLLFKMKGALSGKTSEPAEVAPTTTTSLFSVGIPSIESPAFEKFVETDAFLKLLENEDQLVKAIESA
jgi:hypothetical protein